MAQENYVAPNAITSGAAFADLQNGGLAGIIAKVVAANPAVTAPASQATVSVTGGGASGGSLPAGTYYVSYTYCNGAGETTVGSSRSTSFTSASGNKPRVTFNDTPPTGAVWRNVYLTAAGGAAGTETLYITGVPVATTTVDLLYAAPTYAGTAIPAANTTAFSNILGRIDAGGTGAWELLWTRLSDLISQFLSGQPVDYQSFRVYFNHVRTAMDAWTQALDDIGVLVAANHGSLHYQSTTTMPEQYRSFP